jgi:hypothetical protein
MPYVVQKTDQYAVYLKSQILSSLKVPAFRRSILGVRLN